MTERVIRYCESCTDSEAVLRVDSVLLNELGGREGVDRFWLCRACARVCEDCSQARYWEEVHTHRQAGVTSCDLCRLSRSLEHVMYSEQAGVLNEIAKWSGFGKLEEIRRVS